MNMPIASNVVCCDPVAVSPEIWVRPAGAKPSWDEVLNLEIIPCILLGPRSRQARLGFRMPQPLTATVTVEDGVGDKTVELWIRGVRVIDVPRRCHDKLKIDGAASYRLAMYYLTKGYILRVEQIPNHRLFGISEWCGRTAPSLTRSGDTKTSSFEALPIGTPISPSQIGADHRMKAITAHHILAQRAVLAFEPVCGRLAKSPRLRPPFRIKRTMLSKAIKAAEVVPFARAVCVVRNGSIA
jgi:hypothetical protein